MTWAGSWPRSSPAGAATGCSPATSPNGGRWGSATWKGRGCTPRPRAASARCGTSRLDADGPEGDRLRAEIGAKIAAIGNAENESLGIELGYRYDDLPVICAEPGAPALETLRYKPGTWPGMRAPSLYLADGRALFDLFGPGFTLVAFAGAETAGFARAAAERAMPLAILALDDAHARKVYERDLVLVRPDQHVAWRGAAPPADPGAILDRVRGGGVSA